VEVAVLIAQLKAEIAAFQRNMAAADAILAQTRSQIRETEKTAEMLSTALGGVKVEASQGAQTDAVLATMRSSLSSTTAKAFEADAALGGVKIGAAQTAGTVAGLGAVSTALGDVRDKALEADAAISLASALGFGGGGIRNPLRMMGGGFGFGPRRLFGGFASLGSIAGLAGFGAERALTSTLGIAGSMIGGLAGGGLLAGGLLSTTAVGMGTDAAGIGQAAGDIKTVSTNLGALNSAIQQYGRNSTQAAQAQATLNQSLRGFSPVARTAVLAAAQTSQAFKAMFDKATGQAEKTGAEIINQAMHVGMKFLPTIGKFAAQNTQIIQHGLQPFFTWLQQKGPQGGLGIFTNLEQIFQNRLPTSIHALTQGIELFTKVMDVAAQHTGGLVQKVDQFVSKWNSPANFPRVAAEVGKLISLFRTWMGLLGSMIGLMVDLFKPAVGFGRQFAETLTQIINRVRDWLSASGTQDVLHRLFAAHTQQLVLIGNLIKALLPLLESVVSAFLQIEAAMTQAFNNGLKPIIDAVKWLLSNPLVDKILGWAGAFWLAQRAIVAVDAALGLLVGGSVINGLKGIALGFFGIQTAAVKAATATTAAAAEIDAATAAAGAGVAGEGGLLARLGLGAGAAGIGSRLGRFGGAGLLAGGGFLAGGLARQFVPGQGGRALQGALTGAGIGAGIGSVVPGVGTAVGAGLGALAGTIISLTHTIPSLDDQLGKLGASFVLLNGHARQAGAALGTARNAFANKLNLVGVQAQLNNVTVFMGRLGSRTVQTAATAGQALQNYIQHLTRLADSARSSNPKLAAVYQRLIDIAQAVHKIPSKKTIEIILKYGGDVRIGPGGGIFPTGPRSAFGAGPSGPQPVDLNLPRGIQMQLAAAQAGHGSIEKADAAAYAYYEALLKRHNLTRKQILAIYQAEAAYAPYQTPGSTPRVTGYAGPTGSGMLPRGLAAALASAQARAASAGGGGVTSQMTARQAQQAVAANRALLAQEQQALRYLQNEHATGQKLVAIKKEELAITRQIAATERAITRDLKAQHDLQVQSRINRILGIGGGAGTSGSLSIQQRERNMFIRALEQALGGSRHTIGATARALGITVGQLTRESPQQLLRQMQQHGITLDAKSLAELRKIQEVLRIAHRENMKLTPAETRKITNWLQQIQQELSGTSTLKSNYVAPSARQLTAGLGLTPAQRAAEIARLSSYYMHGHRVPTGGAAGGVPLPAGVGGGVDLPPDHPHRRHHRRRHSHGGAHLATAQPMVITGNVTVHVTTAAKDPAAVAHAVHTELLKIQRRNGAQTRGHNAGRGIGLA
jgi:hypothetical protein